MRMMFLNEYLEGMNAIRKGDHRAAVEAQKKEFFNKRRRPKKTAKRKRRK
jgi:hypothetical protein